MVISYIVSLVAIVFIIIILTVYFQSRNKYDEMIQPLNRNNYPLIFLIPTGLRVTQILKYSYTDKDLKLREHFQELFGENFAPYYLKIHIANKFAGSILLLFIASLVAVGVASQNILTYIDTKNAPHLVLEDNKLLRPEFSESAYGGETAKVEAVIGEGEDSRTITYEINVPMQLPDDQECVERAIKNMEENYIDKWASAFSEGVSENLSLSRFAILGCRVEMLTNPPEYFSDKGQILQRPLESDGKISVNAKFVFSKGAVIEGTKSFDIAIKPTANEIVAVQEVEQYVEGLNKMKSNFISGEYISMPEELSEVPITWKFPDIKVKDDSYLILLGGILLFVILFFTQDSDIDKRVKDKREEIRRDFPDFISKLVLLLSCGMTPYDAIRKIVDDYKLTAEESGKPAKPLYHELEMALTEIECGKSEIYAYEDFGQRCKISEAMKFSSVLTQNLRRGSSDLTLLLKSQAKEIWEMRKAHVKIQGEKAGSKLIFPMMLSLVAVIAVVLYPAMGAM